MEYYYLIGLIVGVIYYSECTCHGYGERTHDLFAFLFSVLSGLAMWPLLILLWLFGRD